MNYFCNKVPHPFQQINKRTVGSLIFILLYSLAFAQSNSSTSQGQWIFGFDKTDFISIGIALAYGILGAVLGFLIAVVFIKIRNRFLKPPYSKNLRTMILIAGILLGFGMISRTYLIQIDLPKQTRVGVDDLLYILQAIGWVLLLLAIWDAFSTRLEFNRKHSWTTQKVLVPVFRKLIQGLLIIGGIVTVGSTLLNINFATVFAGLGIGGVAVALAAKDSVENIFGSLTIVLDMPFGIGDWVRIDKIEGIVEQINLRSTRLRSFDDTIVNLPNANLIRATVENVSARRTRKQSFNIHLKYSNSKDSITQFADSVRKMSAEFPNLASEHTIVRINSLDTDSINVYIQCLFKVVSWHEETKMKEEFLLNILEIGEKLGIRFVDPA